MEQITQRVLAGLEKARLAAAEERNLSISTNASRGIGQLISLTPNLFDEPWFKELVGMLAGVDAPELAEDEEAALRRGDLICMFRYVSDWSPELLANVMHCAENDPLDENRAFALAAIGLRVKDKVWLQARFEDPDFETQIMAARVLTEIGEDPFSIISTLLTRAGDDKENVGLCCQFIGVVETMPFLIEKLLEFKEPARLNAVLCIVHALFRNGLLEPQSKPSLLRVMKPHMVKILAANQASGNAKETDYQLKSLISKCSALAI